MDIEIKYLEKTRVEMMAEADDHFLQCQIDALASKYEEKKICVVKPFLDKFIESSYNPIEEQEMAHRINRCEQKTRADKMEKENKCHKVTYQSEEDFMKTIRSKISENMETLAFQFALDRNTEVNICPTCLIIRRDNDEHCHCNRYYCKLCHKDKVCVSCKKLTVYTAEICQFQYLWNKH